MDEAPLGDFREEVGQDSLLLDAGWHMPRKSLAVRRAALFGRECSLAHDLGISTALSSIAMTVSMKHNWESGAGS